jgi:hypothetical protein
VSLTLRRDCEAPERFCHTRSFAVLETISGAA